MTRSSKRVGYHALIVALVIGAAMSLGLIKLYAAKNYAAKMVIGDGASERLISVHPTIYGLVEVSVIKNPYIVIVNNPKNKHAVIIPSDIGSEALKSSPSY
jgi:hypothetical protein